MRNWFVKKDNSHLTETRVGNTNNRNTEKWRIATWNSTEYQRIGIIWGKTAGRDGKERIKEIGKIQNSMWKKSKY